MRTVHVAFKDGTSTTFLRVSDVYWDGDNALLISQPLTGAVVGTNGCVHMLESVLGLVASDQPAQEGTT